MQSSLHIRTATSRRREDRYARSSARHAADVHVTGGHRQLPTVDHQRQLQRFPAAPDNIAMRWRCERISGSRRVRHDLRCSRQRPTRMGAGRKRQLTDALDAGAVAVKVWKDIGMQQRDADGRAVMIDDARFTPIFRMLEERGTVVLGHLGEPRNAWLPLSEMTINGDREYFKTHPQYHMATHAEWPTYEQQIAARDRMLDSTSEAAVRWRASGVARMERRSDRRVSESLSERIGRSRRTSVASATAGERRSRQSAALVHPVPGSHPVRDRHRVPGTARGQRLCRSGGPGVA